MEYTLVKLETSPAGDIYKWLTMINTSQEIGTFPTDCLQRKHHQSKPLLETHCKQQPEVISHSMRVLNVKFSHKVAGGTVKLNMPDRFEGFSI